MTAADDAARSLAARLRELRRSHWPTIPTITQKQLADVLGTRKEASAQLVSSWESPSKPIQPPEDRLHDIATFFCATDPRRNGRLRLIADTELTDEEASEREELYQELLALRRVALADQNRTVVGRGPWHFPGDRPVTIFCGEVPDHLLKDSPLAARANPDSSELSRFADLDALVQLYGHIRAVNPDLEVRYLSARRWEQDYQSHHLVLLGGIDWNGVTRGAMRLIDAPVRQHSLDDPDRGYFEVAGEPPKKFAAVTAGSEVVEDVGHLVRAPNPFDQDASVTFCNGMYAAGNLGAVRTLTAEKFRDRNAGYLADRFGDAKVFSLLFRVQIVNKVVATPLWTAPRTVLHSWPAASPE